MSHNYAVWLRFAFNIKSWKLVVLVTLLVVLWKGVAIALCLLFLIYCSRFPYNANGLERRAITPLRIPVAPPSGGAVKVIQSRVENLKKGQILTTYVAFERQKTGDLREIGKHSQKNRVDAMNVLKQWKKEGKGFYWKEPGTLYSDGTTRLDLQGKFDRNGIRFANLQLQINGQNVPQPSSIAQVSIEIGTPSKTRGLEGMTHNLEVNFAATALQASLRNERKAWVFQELTDARGKLLQRNTRG